MNNNILKIDNLNYNIFHNFNLSIKEKDYIIIAGSNASGKTTLIKILAGLISIEKCIKYKEEFFENINKNIIYNEIAAIFSREKSNFKYATTEEELFSILDNIDIDSTKKIRKYQEIIELLNIEEILGEDPKKLNKFYEIKILLAASLLSFPKILLIDDICYGLNKKESKELLKIIKKLNKKMIIIVTSSNLEYGTDADYIYVLDKGSIVFEGSKEEILKEDNKLEKLGIKIPIMYDLSVKLADYEIINETITNMNKMVEKLWK